MSVAVTNRSGAAHSKVCRAAGERQRPPFAHLGRFQNTRHNERRQEPTETENQRAENASGKGTKTTGKRPEREGETAAQSGES